MSEVFRDFASKVHYRMYVVLDALAASAAVFPGHIRPTVGAPRDVLARVWNGAACVFILGAAGQQSRVNDRMNRRLLRGRTARLQVVSPAARGLARDCSDRQSCLLRRHVLWVAS